MLWKMHNAYMAINPQLARTPAINQWVPMGVQFEDMAYSKQQHMNAKQAWKRWQGNLLRFVTCTGRTDMIFISISTECIIKADISQIH